MQKNTPGLTIQNRTKILILKKKYDQPSFSDIITWPLFRDS